MDKSYPIKIWGCSRVEKKTFFTKPSITHAIAKANNCGLYGIKLVLEVDGTEICDDEVLQYYMEENAVFLLLREEQEWMPQIQIPTISTFNIEPTSSLNDFENIQPNFLVENAELPQVEAENDQTTVSGDCDTMTIASTPTSSIHCSNALLFSRFNIPWEKIPSDIMLMLQNKQNLGKRLNCLGNLLVDELRIVSQFIPMSIIRALAQQMASKFPDSMLQRDNEKNIISTIPLPLITIMKNRNSFLNRSPKRTLTHLESDIPVNQRKKACVLKETCSNWQPSCLPNGESVDTIKSKKKYLQNIHKKGYITPDERGTIHQFMKDSFAVQRKFLNNRNAIPTMQEIQNEWPFLFDKEGVYIHFKELMSFDVTKLKSTFESQKSTILKFLNSSKKKDIMQNIKEKTDCSAIIKCLFIYFNEDSTYLYKYFDFGTTLDEIKQECASNTPWAAVLKTTILEDEESVYLFIERILVGEYKNMNILDMLAIIIAFYYNFNILYPKQISQTMEFMVRYFLKHYSEKSRGSKNHINNNSKINNLILRLATTD